MHFHVMFEIDESTFLFRYVWGSSLPNKHIYRRSDILIKQKETQTSSTQCFSQESFMDT